MNEFIPQIITNGNYNIYGILRKRKLSKEIFIILPANTGTRIGPQRIFTEIAMALFKNNISSFCVDLPPHGDSYDNEITNFKGSFFEILDQKYSFYLNAIIEYLQENYDFEKFSLMSISYGCIPSFSYALKHEINRLVLLSPDNLIGGLESINKKNLKSYYLKIFNRATWLKLIKFKLNYKIIFRNIYSSKNKRVRYGIKGKDIRRYNNFTMLNIFGEKDKNQKYFIDHWDKQIEKYGIKKYNYQIIKNSDHSFFGWQFKRDVERKIVAWLGIENK